MIKGGSLRVARILKGWARSGGRMGGIAAGGEKWGKK